ncbi:MAG: hypothetical protein KG029_20070 [Bacteroidetes bacterium]|jgi:hypothetical protein|nr:hypothetical protein [Bacteroidota bacterium]
MYIKYFLEHQWKQATRSAIWQKNLAVNLIMGFFFSILFLELVVISYLLGFKWHEIIETGDPIIELHRMFAWYFAGMFAVRFFMQKLPALEVRPYLHLPLKKSSLVHFLLFKGSINLFTLISIVFFIPFAVFQINYYHNASVAWMWFLAVFSIDLGLNYFVLYLKKQMVASLKIVSLILAIILILAAGDYFGWYSYSKIVGSALDALLLKPAFLAGVFLLPIAMYVLNYIFLRDALYLENLSKDSDGNLSATGQIGYLKKLGLIGELISMDIRLYLRNKRTKSWLYMTPIFLLYGLFFYPSGEYTNDSGFMIFIGIFVTSVMMINYLQYAFAYEGNFFDFIITSGIKMEDYLQAKMTLAYGIGIACYILTVPYIYFGTEIFLINTACFLFGIGLVAPSVLYFASYNKKTMVISKGGAFSYQGIGAMHFFILMPVFIVPLFIFLPFKWAGNPEMGWIALAATGLLALPFRKYFLQLTLKNLQQRKYIMAAGLREKS